MHIVELVRLNAVDARDPREEWSLATIGPKVIMQQDIPVTVWAASSTWWTVKYKFKDPAHALMFRLRWEEA